MRTVLTAFCSVMILGACGITSGQAVNRSEADAIAIEYHLEFARQQPEVAKLLGPVKVDELKDGWHYSWKCRTGLDSKLGVFVSRTGGSDYDEAPDCGNAGAT